MVVIEYGLRIFYSCSKVAAVKPGEWGGRADECLDEDLLKDLLFRRVAVHSQALLLFSQLVFAVASG